MTPRRLGLLSFFALLVFAAACLAGAFGGDPIERIYGVMILFAAFVLAWSMTPGTEIEP